MPPHQGKFIAYFRVSMDKQGKSGLGLDALMESGLEFIAVHNRHATQLTVHILAAVGAATSGS